jgi:translation initiation factor IF-3
VGFRRRRWRDLRPEEEKVRVNRFIRVPQVRVINEDGQQLGIMATEAARDIASRVGLDLVEIAPTARPPVCKIMDYGRYKYELKKKAAVAKKSQHQSQLKEIKFRPHISEHDLEFKLKNARKFLMDGDKVKCTVMFRGREIVHSQVGRELIKRVAADLGEIASLEHDPQMSGRMMSTTLAPNRASIDRIKARERQQQAQAAQAEAEAASADPEATPAAAEAAPAEGDAAQAAADPTQAEAEPAAPKEVEGAQD